MSSMHKLSNTLINKWAPLVGNGPSNKVMALLLENQEKYSRSLTLFGPYYCDELGKYVDVDDAANPEYDPYVIFKTDSMIPTESPIPTRTYVYHLDKEIFYLRTPIIINNHKDFVEAYGDKVLGKDIPYTPEEAEKLVNRLNLPSVKLAVVYKKHIPDWIIEEIFKREPSIYTSGIGNFAKFAMPLIRKSFPSLIPNLISVQPMTGPIGGVAFYRPRYGKGKGSI